MSNRVALDLLWSQNSLDNPTAHIQHPHQERFAIVAAIDPNPVQSRYGFVHALDKA